MTATKVLVCKKAAEARDLIKCHPLALELATELSAHKGIGTLRFSAALIAWSKGELQGLQRICVQAYKNEWHVPWSTANSLNTFPGSEACHEYPLLECLHRP